MAKGQISLLIEAQDKATPNLKKINQLLAGTGLSARKLAVQAKKTDDQTKKLGASVKKVKDQGNLGQIAKGLGRIATTGKEAALSITRIITPLSAITGAASIAGLYKLTSSFADFGTHLKNNAAYSRMGVAEYQSWVNAGRMAGVSAETMESSIGGLNDTLHDMVGGRAPDAVMMANKIGLSFRDASGHARNAADVIPELTDKIAGIKDPYYQAAVAQRFFGGSARELLPFLRLGSKGMAEYRQAAIRHGLVNEAGARSADELRRAQTELTMSVEGLGYAVASKLAPVLVPMLTSLTNYIDKNRDKVGDFFAMVADRIKKWVESGGIQKDYCGCRRI